MTIEIRPVTTIEECREIEDIIMAAWGGGYEISVPDHFTITIAKENGGVVLLAKDGAKPVGFCLGFLSYVGLEKRLKHHSHLAAVIPEYRGQRLGERIKWAQREAVLAMDIDHITWTFDPLETRNGRLNIHKLGAVCNTYKRNVYGDVRDDLNKGVPTDRFQVDWWLASPWVQAHYEGKPCVSSLSEWLDNGTMVVNPPVLKANIWHVGDIDKSCFTHPHLLVAVPRDYQHVKKANIDLGLTWRWHAREIFEQAFASEYLVVDLLINESLCYYVLHKGGSLPSDESC